MRVNVRPHNKARLANIGEATTHEGAPAFYDTPEKELRRAVLACLLFEDQFYENGKDIAARISELAALVDPVTTASLAVEARSVYNLRHVPLLLLCALARTGAGGKADVAGTVERTVQRADELGELLAVYWRDGKSPIAAGLKRGLARALRKFSAYSLGKYDRDNAKVRLRDVLFMVHAKPRDEEQAAVWKKLVDKTLESPDTWEVALSGGANKRETFTRLLSEGKLGYLALLRNLRNMVEADVDRQLISDAIIARKNGAERVLPFRYIAAARAAPSLEPVIDQALCAAISEMPWLSGKTVVLVDVSGSMGAGLSRKSDLNRMDAAAALASIIPGHVQVLTFSNRVVEVPPRRGMAGVDAVINSQDHGGTMLGLAVATANSIKDAARVICITDEQSHDRVPDPVAPKAYMVNVASYKPSVAYGPWTRIEGFSENVLRYIHATEKKEDLHVKQE